MLDIFSKYDDKFLYYTIILFLSDINIFIERVNYLNSQLYASKSEANKDFSKFKNNEYRPSDIIEIPDKYKNLLVPFLKDMNSLLEKLGIDDELISGLINSSEFSKPLSENSGNNTDNSESAQGDKKIKPEEQRGTEEEADSSSKETDNNNYNDNEDKQEDSEPSSTDKDSDNPSKAKPIPSKKGKGRRKKNLDESQFETEETMFNLLENNRFCKHDQCELKHFKYNVRKLISIKPAKIFIKKEYYQVCSCPKCSAVYSVKYNPQILPKTSLSHEFYAHIIDNKCNLSTPIYRQERQFKLLGFNPGRANMVRQVNDIGEKLKPLVEELSSFAKSTQHLQCDETTMKVIKSNYEIKDSKSYILNYKTMNIKPDTPVVTIYRYMPTRSMSNISKHFRDFKGVLQVDGFAGYNFTGSSEFKKLNDQCDIIRIGCFAHLRRYFVDAFEKGANNQNLAKNSLEYINNLFKIDSEIKDNFVGDDIKLQRSERLMPIYKKLLSTAFENINKVLKKTLLYKAFNYLISQSCYLELILNGTLFPLTNNACERSIKDIIIGRKNWLHAFSDCGADALMNLYSIVNTARLNDVNPYEYLVKLFDTLALDLAQKEKHDNQLLSDSIDRYKIDYQKYFPWNLMKEECTC